MNPDAQILPARSLMMHSPSNPRIRLSLGQAMVVILITGLCLAPLLVAAKTGEGEQVLIAVFFDVIVLPALCSIGACVLLDAGPNRNWLVKAFWLTPLIFLCVALTVSVPIIIFSPR